MTPVVITLLPNGEVSLFYPTVKPVVPALGLSDFHSEYLYSIRTYGAHSNIETIQLSSILEDLFNAKIHHDPLEDIKRSLQRQHLWPFDAGIFEDEVYELEERERRKLKLLSKKTFNDRCIFHF